MIPLLYENCYISDTLKITSLGPLEGNTPGMDTGASQGAGAEGDNCETQVGSFRAIDKHEPKGESLPHGAGQFSM